MWIQAVNQPQYFLGWFKGAFEASHPGVKLDIQIGSNLGTGLDVALNGRDAPDLVSTWGGLIVPTLVAGNRILDLSDILDPLEENMINMALLNKVGGKHYSAPIFGFASPVIYYNKTVFDSLGLSAPTTYDELVQLCKDIRAVKKGDGSQKYKTLVTGYSYHLMQALHARTMSQEELYAIIGEHTEGVANPFQNDGYLQGWKFLEQMRDDNIFATNIGGYTTSTSESEFVNQSALMIACPSLDLLNLSDTAPIQIGSFILPDAPTGYAATSGTKNPSVSGIYTDVLCVNAKTQHAEACREVIRFLYTQAAQEKLFDNFLFPVLKDISYANVSANVKDVFDTAFKPIYDQANREGMSLFYMSYFYKTGLDSNLETNFKNIMSKTKTAAQARDEIATSW